MEKLNTDDWVQGSADLSSCDREPVHLIGAIQPIGFLVAVSVAWLITRVSSNASNHLGRPVDALLGAPLTEILGVEAIHTIRNRTFSFGSPDTVERVFGVQLQDGGARFDLSIHKVEQTIIIEGEPSESAGELNAGTMVRSMLDRMEGEARLVHKAARLMQALTGFDRVMIYRFHPDDSGEVIGECVQAGLEPYLGLRYPASDIPQQARALLLRNPVRLLYDIDAEPSLIVPQLNEANEPLDLSMSTLRAHSAMHIEYLRNMGVRATMTISLVRSGKLWGLISCHHMRPRHVGFERRTTAELFARMLTFLIDSRERDALTAYEARARLIHNELIASFVETGFASGNITQLADRMAEIMPCNGIGVCVRGHVTLKGSTPTVEEFAALRSFLERTTASPIYATEELGHVYPPANVFSERVAGMLVIPISRVPRDYIVFFRHEVASTVTWAGNPSKFVEVEPAGASLTPRKSFAAWHEIVRGHSTPWTEAELRAADALRITLLELVLHLSEITEQERQAALQKQELLIAELNHRVRNILGLIRGLVAQSRTSTADIDTFATVLGDRVHALARAHDQITAKNWGPGPLAVLIANEAGAYLGVDAIRVHARGPSVLLQPQAFSTVALVIHELMTNAAKYGALRGPHGQVTIEWKLDVVGDIVLDWTEVNGPMVQTPTRRGFGTTIIERSIPHELGGDAQLNYMPTGMHGRFRVPSQHVVVSDDKDVNVVAVAITAAVTAAPTRLSGSVLLVEDNVIIALDAEDILLTLGAEHVTVASNVGDALRRLEYDTPSFALLDVNLGPERSWAVATRLRELGVRHAFATGYGNGIDYPPEHRSTPSITKPYSSESIARAVSQAFGQ